MSFGEIFNPGLRHLREEKDRHQMLVSRPTHGGGAPLGIDLEAGVARITVRKPVPEPVPEATSDPAEPATGLDNPDPDPDDPERDEPAVHDSGGDDSGPTG